MGGPSTGGRNASARAGEGSPATAPTLPCIQFNSDDLPPDLRFAYFRQAMSVTFDVSLHDTPEAEFSLQARIWRLGRIMINSRRCAAGLRMERLPRQAKIDGIDHYVLVLMHDSGLVGDAAGVPIVAPAGSVVVLDLAHPMTALAPPNASVSYTVPQDELEGLLPVNCPLHGMVVEGAAGGLLADYLGSLERRLPYITQEEAPHIERGTYGLIAACVAPTRERLERASSQVTASLRQEVRRAVDEKLSDPDLSPEAVADVTGLSRTALYTLLEHDGGVAAFIRRRRLRAAGRALSDPAERRRVSDIAFACGFKSEAHFSRAFRQEFSATPSDVRSIAGTPSSIRRPSLPNLAEQYQRWIREQDD